VGLSLLAGCLAWKVVGNAQRAGNAESFRVSRRQKAKSNKSVPNESTKLLKDSAEAEVEV
jgi:hypothetical protein